MYIDSGSSSSWWYPERRSILLKTVAPLRSGTSSSTVGVTGRVRRIALFASRMSTQSLMSDGFWDFGGVTKRDTHPVGPVTFSMMSSLSSLWSSFSTLSLRWNGTRLCFLANGGTDLSMYNLTRWYLSFPVSAQWPGYLSRYVFFRYQRRWTRLVVDNLQYLQCFDSVSPQQWRLGPRQNEKLGRNRRTIMGLNISDQTQ